MDEVSLRNEILELSVNSRTGSISKIFNRRTSIPYLKRAPEQALYLWFLQTGKKSKHYANDDEPVRILVPSDETLDDIQKKDNEQGSSIEVSHELDSVHVSYEYSLRERSPLVECKVSVKNSSKSQYSNTIVGVGFPQIQGICIGHDSRDDILVRPNRFGEKIRDPVARAGTYHSCLLYGGFASMMWMDIYDKNAGLYMASYDKDLLLTALEAIPNERSGTMTLGMRKYAYVPSNSSWESNPFVIGVHEGDWHWAADRYREWADSWMVRPKVPENLKLTDGWYGVNLKRDGVIQFGFKDIEDIYEDARYLGLSHIQLWGQMVGDGCCYRFYYPDPNLGTIQELKSAISAVKKKGGHIGFYFNIQAFSPYVKEYLSKKGYRIPEEEKIPDWIQEFRKFAQENFDGAPTVQYPGREFENDGFRIMCTFSEGWQDYILHWTIGKYLREYGADFAYIDQVFSPPVSYCFNFEHGHEHHGCSVQGRVNTIRRLSEEGRKLDPNFSICIEGNGDSVGQFCDLHLYTSFSSQTRYPAPEVFAYTFPEYIIIDGFANFPVEWIGKCYYPDMNEPVALEDLMNRVYLLGFRFDVTSLPAGTRIRQGEALTEHIRKLIRLRKKIKHFQYNSTFNDDVGLRCSSERVIAKVFKVNGKGALLINMIDYRKEKKPFTIGIEESLFDAAGQFKAMMHTIEGQELEIQSELSQDLLLLSVPNFEGKTASIILE